MYRAHLAIGGSRGDSLPMAMIGSARVATKAFFSKQLLDFFQCHQCVGPFEKSIHCCYLPWLM
jgi:hypothetical protein